MLALIVSGLIVATNTASVAVAHPLGHHTATDPAVEGAWLHANHVR